MAARLDKCLSSAIAENTMSSAFFKKLPDIKDWRPTYSSRIQVPTARNISMPLLVSMPGATPKHRNSSARKLYAYNYVCIYTYMYLYYTCKAICVDIYMYMDVQKYNIEITRYIYNP